MNNSRFYTKYDDRKNKLTNNILNHKHNFSYQINHGNQNHNQYLCQQWGNRKINGNGNQNINRSYIKTNDQINKNLSQEIKKIGNTDDKSNKKNNKKQRIPQSHSSKQSHPKQQSIKINGVASNIDRNTNINKIPTRNDQIKKQYSKNSTQRQTVPGRGDQKCLVCGMLTEKCCSLCRQAFYCSLEHQEQHWHQTHKYSCQRNCQNVNSNNVKMANNNFTTSHSNNQNNTEYNTYNTNSVFQNNNDNSHDQFSKGIIQKQKIQRFLQMLQKQYLLRKKIINQLSNINQKYLGNTCGQIIKQTQQLFKISQRIIKSKDQYNTQFYLKINKTHFHHYGSELGFNEIDASQVGVGLAYIADAVLMSKVYHLCGMGKQSRQIIILIGKILQDSQQKKIFLQNKFLQQKPQNTKKINLLNMSNSHQKYNNIDINNNNINNRQSTYQHSSLDPLSKIKQQILYSIIQMSQYYNVDKTTQSVYRVFIKKIQIQQGIWQQIYSYFNIGIWYMKKTYYQKSVQTFIHCVQLIDHHKKNVMTEVVCFKANCLYNMGLGYWSGGEQNLAIEKMSECYRMRINCIGKNSMECSKCLYNLSKWFRDMQRWHECLAYLQECHRIRKLYQGQGLHVDQFIQIKNLIAEVHDLIRRQKRKNNGKIFPNLQTTKQGQSTSNCQNLGEKLVMKKYLEQEKQPEEELNQNIIFEKNQSIKGNQSNIV